MVTVFIVCWGPYATLSMIGVLGFSKVKSQLRVHLFQLCKNRCQYFLCIWFMNDKLSWLHVQHIHIEWTVAPVLFAKSAIIWNPLIYICMNKQVRIKENTITFFKKMLTYLWWEWKINVILLSIVTWVLLIQEVLINL